MWTMIEKGAKFSFGTAPVAYHVYRDGKNRSVAMLFRLPSNDQWYVVLNGDRERLYFAGDETVTLVEAKKLVEAACDSLSESHTGGRHEQAR